MAVKSAKWLKLFQDFIGDIRISSKESISQDERGAKLELWESQRRFIQEVGSGLDEDIHKFYCLKSRQLGVTTVSLAIDVFWMALHPNIIGCLVTDTEKNREANRMLLEKYVESFPDGYFGETFKIVRSNRQMLQFSNGARLDLLVAGTKDKGTSWGEGVGYAFGHLTEVAAYGSAEGLKSLEEGFAQTNPNRLFIYESTAKGFNHWRTRYVDGINDPLTARSFFVGWWAGDTNKIPRKDPRFLQHGLHPPEFEEKELIDAVKSMYGHKIAAEQLAWIRWKTESAGAEQALLDQNQPWTAEQAFVQTGYSFFQTRVITQDIKKIEEENIRYKAYRYEVDGDFFNFRMFELKPGVDSPDDIELKVWEEPVEGAKYVIGMDPAYGRNDHKDHHCLSEDTEILTKQGWKKYQDVQVGIDEAVCFDPKTTAYSYGIVSDKIVKPHAGLMYNFTSKGLDCLATPEHRVVSRNYRVLRNGKKQSWAFYTAEQIASSGRSVREIPVGGAPAGKGIENLSPLMCRALGWVLTDGHVSNGKYTGKLGQREGRRAVKKFIMLTQSETTVKAGVKIAEEMRKGLAQLCPDAYVVNLPARGRAAAKTVWRINVKDAEPFIEWLGEDTNRIPRRILEEGSLEQLEALFQGILDGDGGWCNREQQWVKVCPGLDYDFASDIQELAAKLGYSVSICAQKPKAGTVHNVQWIVRLSTRDAHTFEATNVSSVYYEGNVWCVTVPTGAFVARRNGKMFVTGNCISVWRCFADKVVQVAEYATADVEAKHAAWVLFHLSSAYVDCLVNPEVGGPGALVLGEFDHLRQLLSLESNAERVKARGWEDAAAHARMYLYKRPDSMGAGYVIGFSTTWATQSVLMHQVRGCYVSRELEIKSRSLLNEMSLVVVEDGHIGAPESRDENCKDDRVFAMAFAVRAWKDWTQREMMGQGMTYEAVMAAQKGEKPTVATTVNRIVFNYLRTMQEQSEEEVEPPTWQSEYGL